MSTPDFKTVCPAPRNTGDIIEVAHGGGGRRTHELIASVFLEAFGDALDTRGHDGAVFECATSRLAMTTDSFVVQPLEFPGGDIGSLAVHGTVNDLLMCGAHPRHLSAAFVLEAGLEIERLRHIAASMRRAADDAGVAIVTGDTKVVQHARGDGMTVTTTGVGEVVTAAPIGPASVRPDARIILSGDLGRHGVAVMTTRERLELAGDIRSDSAALVPAVLPMLERGIEVQCLRDLTRGGLATALVEIARTAEVDIEIEEAACPVQETVRGACELLGLDPLYVANEGRFIAIVPPHAVDEALAAIRDAPVGADACVIGRTAAGRGQVTARTPIGSRRVIDMLSGEQLPRIC